jgi:hypothetical protein
LDGAREVDALVPAPSVGFLISDQRAPPAASPDAAGL